VQPRPALRLHRYTVTADHINHANEFQYSRWLLEEFDQVWEDEGIDNRSRAVREAMQEYIERK